MSNQSFSIRELEQLKDPVTGSPPSPTVSWGVVLLLGVMISWQLVRQRDRNPSAPGSHAARSLVGGIETTSPSQMHFTQALQWVSYGKDLERSKQYEEAVAVYDQGLSHHPHDFRLWHERGLALAKLQRFQDAIQSYDRAYTLRPDDRDLAHERGDTLLELEQYEAAIVAFDTYLRYAPGNAHILTDRGYALYQLKRYEAALQTLNQVLQGSQQDRDSLARAHYYQIESLRQSGQLKTALLSSQKALKQYPTEFFTTQHEKLQQQISILNEGKPVS